MTFPREVLDMVTGLLSIQDIGNVRCASSVFVGIFYDQHFWRKRFAAGGERSWLFEARQYNDSALNRGALYRGKGAKHLSARELNRFRIWGVLQEVREVLDLQWSATPQQETPDVASG